MALAFETKEKSLTGGAYNSVTPRAIQNVQVKTWDALAIDDLSPPLPLPLKPEDVTELNVLNYKTGGFRFFPEPNVDIFQFYDSQAATLNVQPWLICSNIRAERNTERHELFRVVSEYNSGQRFQLSQDQLELIAPPVSVAAYPFVVETVWGGEERILTEENVSSPINPLHLPTGSLYAEPFYGKFPKRSIRQSQFELFADDDAVNAAIGGSGFNNRLFSTNATSFMGDPGEPPRWMITEIDYQHVRLPLSTGSVADAYLMTYLIERSEAPGGWNDRRALVDNYYLDPTSTPPNARTPARDDVDKSSIVTIQLNFDGTKRLSQTGDPLFIDYREQPPISWTFLK